MSHQHPIIVPYPSERADDAKQFLGADNIHREGEDLERPREATALIH